MSHYENMRLMLEKDEDGGFGNDVLDTKKKGRS